MHVLLEFDEPHTRREDVRERARALSPNALVRVVFAGGDPEPDEEPVRSSAWAAVPRAEWREALARMIRPGATVVLAGDEAIETAQGAPELASCDVQLWPTRLSGDAAADRVALDCAVAAITRGLRARDSLWDGDYVLVPGMPDDAAAELVIEGFAELAGVRPSLDLVFLADSAPRFEALVRDLDVRWRVHWAGPAPLRAECTWLAGASAVVLTDREAADASQALRAVALASPVVVAGGGARARHFHRWLEELGGSIAALERSPEGVAEAIGARLAAHGAAETRERMLRIVRAHEPKALAAGLHRRLIPAGRLAA